MLTRIASYVAGDCDQSFAAVVELAAWQEAAVPDPGKLRAGEELRQMVHEGRGDLLWHFPAEERTHSLCLAAVRSFGMALRWVPPEHITPGMCEAALKNDGLALQWVVPPTRITSEMCYAAVRTAALALAFAPEKHLTPKLSEAAVRANWRALAFVPEAHLRERLFSIALNQDARALRLIPAGYRTLETYTLAFRRGFLPNDLLREERTTEVLRAAADVARQDQRVHAAVPALDASAR